MKNHWEKEILELKKIASSCGLSEETKWGKPCFVYQESNVALIQPFKNYCALLFFKGVLLKDSKKILVKMGENTEIGRQLRFTSVSEIKKLAPTIKAYLKEAIALEKNGVKIEKKTAKLKLVDELQIALKKNAKLKKAFDGLTPGRQRAYNIFISSAKQAKTREARVQKCVPTILQGKGLND